jgi:hypothetical protein
MSNFCYSLPADIHALTSHSKKHGVPKEARRAARWVLSLVAGGHGGGSSPFRRPGAQRYATRKRQILLKIDQVRIPGRCAVPAAAHLTVAVVLQPLARLSMTRGAVGSRLLGILPTPGAEPCARQFFGGARFPLLRLSRRGAGRLPPNPYSHGPLWSLPSRRGSLDCGARRGAAADGCAAPAHCRVCCAAYRDGRPRLDSETDRATCFDIVAVGGWLGDRSSSWIRESTGADAASRLSGLSFFVAKLVAGRGAGILVVSGWLVQVACWRFSVGVRWRAAGSPLPAPVLRCW